VNTLLTGHTPPFTVVSFERPVSLGTWNKTTSEHELVAFSIMQAVSESANPSGLAWQILRGWCFYIKHPFPIISARLAK
jgi:hypothetical protein